MVLDDGLPTPTSRDQAELERRVLQIYAKDYGNGGQTADRPQLFGCSPPPPPPPLSLAAARAPSIAPPADFDREDEGLVLNRQAHAKYLAAGLGELPSSGCQAARG